MTLAPTSRDEAARLAALREYRILDTPPEQTYDELAKAVKERFGGLSDRIALAFPKSTPEGLARELLADVRRIPAPFQGWA